LVGWRGILYAGMSDIVGHKIPTCPTKPWHGLASVQGLAAGMSPAMSGAGQPGLPVFLCPSLAFALLDYLNDLVESWLHRHDITIAPFMVSSRVLVKSLATNRPRATCYY
jgi:hypothetical protein